MEKPGASTRKKSKTDGNQVAQMLNNGTRPFLSVSRKPKQAKQNHWLQVSSKSHFPETAFFTALSPNHLSPFSLPLSIYIPICLSQAQASSAIFTQREKKKGEKAQPRIGDGKQNSLDCGSQRWSSGGFEGSRLLQMELHSEISSPACQEQSWVPLSI